MNWKYLPYVLSAVGVVLGLVLVFQVVAIAAFGGGFAPEAAVTFASSVPFILVLVGGGYWLTQQELSTDRYPRIAGWTLGGTLFLTAVFSVIAAVTPGGTMVALGIVHWAVSVGAGAGLLVGIFEARAVERAVVAEQVRVRNEELRKQNERLDELAGIISHDLRNPLNVADGYLELVREESEDERLDATKGALERMERIIEETLTLARSGRVIDDPESVALADIAEESWRNVETGSATLEVDGSMRFLADTNRLRHLFENLFRNAVEHGGTGDDDSSVTVRVGVLPDGFYIEDDGVGIGETDRDDVFDAGYSTARTGSGFGLAIVEQIVDAHGWEVTLTESDAGGARFEFTGVETASNPSPNPSPVPVVA